ncbi:hypothetical protein [Sphingobacterium sp.]|uniref:hypothetical protein n=1 Tax=Sphingobacterium sp. TaxID=341027 RepID=UPI002582D91C|nr:hypothetical protein [Sphingobacterium sp.]WET67873.1 MAG: hypothetical protein P0Y57_18705 [Sphingobacterium sp.]
MNKRLLLSTTLLLCSAGVAFAQQKGTSDISVTVGAATSTDLANLFTNILTEGLTGREYSTRNMKAGPSFGLTYRYAVADRWMVHADGFYQKMTEDLYLSNVKSDEFKYSYITVGLGSDYRYISKEYFQMYSGLAVAYTSESIDNSGQGASPKGEGFFNYQVNAAGFRVGKKLAGFAELGFGYKGIANVGVSYQF